MIAVSIPDSLAATARCTAIVVLPAPPFSLTIASTFTQTFLASVVDNATDIQREGATRQQHNRNEGGLASLQSLLAVDDFGINIGKQRLCPQYAILRFELIGILR
jgi:hypothetical protein